MLSTSRAKIQDRTIGESGWSERRGLVLTPRRRDVSSESKAAAENPYPRPSPFADPRALYRVSKDYLMTDALVAANVRRASEGVDCPVLVRPARE